MKKFKYRLESLLKIKEHIEKEKQKALAHAMGKVSEQQNSLDSIDKDRVGTLDGQRSTLSGRISLAEALVYSRYLLKLKRDSFQGGELLSVLENKAEDRRVELVGASRERQIYDKLKEKLKERHISDLKEAERKQVDEMATTHFIRNRSVS